MLLVSIQNPKITVRVEKFQYLLYGKAFFFARTISPDRQKKDGREGLFRPFSVIFGVI